MKPMVIFVVLSILAAVGQAQRPGASQSASRVAGPPASKPAASAPSAAAIAKAIAAMRHIDPTKVAKEEQPAKGKELDEAWQTLASGGQASVTALKAELAQIDQSGEKDDFFKLGAAAVLWETAKLDEALTIAEIWARTPPSIQPNYVFFTAHEAAMTQDPRALPMLKAVLRDDTLCVPLPQHAMNLTHPATQFMIWGAFGHDALPVLLDVLKTSQDKVELQTAMKLLTLAQYLPALPEIRKLARHSDPDVAGAAVEAIGTFGHPADFDFILAGLDQTDPKMLTHYVYAAYEFGDVRAAPKLVALLDKPIDDPDLKEELLGTLGYLICPEVIEAAVRKSKDANADADVKDRLGKLYAAFLKTVDMTEEQYAAATPQQKQAACQKLRQLTEKPYLTRPGDRALSHDELVKACADWKANHRITGGAFEWVEDRHVEAAATPADLDMLYDVRAAVLARVSDEALEEAETLYHLIVRIGRMRYRLEPGLTEHVTATKGPQTRPIPAGASSQPTTKAAK